MRHFFVLLQLLVLAPLGASGDPGEPLAVRFWPHSVISIETHWDLEIVVNLKQAAELPAELADADLVLSTLPDEAGSIAFTLNSSAAGEAPQVRHLRLAVSDLDAYFDRPPNQSVCSFASAADVTFVSQNAIHFSQLATEMLLISVDGVRLAIPLTSSLSMPDDALPIDAVLVPRYLTIVPNQFESLQNDLQQLRPRFIVLSKFVATSSTDATMAWGNTLAISQAAEDNLGPRLIKIEEQPWSMPPELAQLFANKERACLASQAVFEKLSVPQMNFKPENGTHTPRWNAEHMMGRELLFFSQIYAKRDVEIKPMDLNPKQMPPDYEARNPDWHGQEEARQLQRVSAFTRRFAYLLDGLDLEQSAPGSFWSPRGLLVQMEKHYQDHTANVIKKFDLATWPKE